MARLYPNRGVSPRSKTIPLHIIWANGLHSKWTYTADQLRWTLTGSEFDVGQFYRADGMEEAA